MDESKMETCQLRLTYILSGMYTHRTKFANGQFQLLFKENERTIGLDQWATDLMPYFTDKAIELLSKPKPPTLAELKSLNRIKSNDFASYVLLAERDDGESNLYTGSGTESTSGFDSRQGQYDRLDINSM